MFYIPLLSIANAVQAEAEEIPNSEATTILGIIFLFLLLVLFVISGSQVAYFSLDDGDINTLKTKEQSSYKRILELLDRQQDFFSALQVGYFFVTLALVILGSFIVNNLLAIVPLDYWLLLLVKVAALFILILLFGEMIPRLFAAQNAIRFARDFSLLAGGLFYFFGRMGRGVYKSSFRLESLLFYKKSRAQFNSQELDSAIDQSFVTDATSEEEKNILKGIVKFSAIVAKQVMIPRLDVRGIEYDSSFTAVVAAIEKLHFSRLLVYKGDLDNAVGVLHTKNVLPHLNDGDGFDWHTLIHPPYFVHEHKLIESLLHEFQSAHRHIAIVVDEFGGTSGIITLEDIQEEIIGEIKDEYDKDEHRFTRVDNETFIFDGKMSLIDACRIMNISSDTFDNDKGDSNTVAGLVLEIAKSFPELNQKIELGDFEFTVLEMSENRLQKIQVVIHLPSE